jgi:hypothetical protein
MPVRQISSRVSAALTNEPLEKPRESTKTHTIRRAAACRNTLVYRALAAVAS